MSTSKPAAVALTLEQQRCLEEWRHLCLTLERAQGENLVTNCHDKFQFAKTYMVYGRDLEQTVSELKHSCTQGNYRFFADRGLRQELLTMPLVETMIRDWRGAIASKKTLVAEVFQKRFGEDVDHFIATPHNASRLFMATSFDETDAIQGLAEWTQNRLSAAELGQLRSDVAQIKSHLDRLTELVTTQLGEVRRLLEQRG